MSRVNNVGRYTRPESTGNEEAYRREEYARLREDIERKRRAALPQNIRGRFFFHNKLFYD